MRISSRPRFDQAEKSPLIPNSTSMMEKISLLQAQSFEIASINSKQDPNNPEKNEKKKWLSVIPNEFEFKGYGSLFDPHPSNPNYLMERVMDQLILNPYKYNDNMKDVKKEMMKDLEKYDEFPIAKVCKMPIFEEIMVEIDEITMNKKTDQVKQKTSPEKIEIKPKTMQENKEKIAITSFAFDETNLILAYVAESTTENGTFSCYLKKLKEKNNAKNKNNDNDFIKMDYRSKIYSLAFYKEDMKFMADDQNEETVKPKEKKLLFFVATEQQIIIYEIDLKKNLEKKIMNEIEIFKLIKTLSTYPKKYFDKQILTIMVKDQENCLFIFKDRSVLNIKNYQNETKAIAKKLKGAKKRILIFDDSLIYNENQSNFAGITLKLVDIEIYSLTSGAEPKFSKPLTIKDAHSEPITRLIFSKKNNQEEHLISGDKSNTIRLWNYLEFIKMKKEANKKDELNFLPLLTINSNFVGEITAIISYVSNENNNNLRIISASSDKYLRIWKISKEKKDNENYKSELVGICHQKNELKHLKVFNFNINGPRKILTCSKRTIRIYDYNSIEKITENYIMHQGKVNALCVTHNGKNIISATENNIITVWDSKSLLLQKMFKHEAAVNCLKVTSDNKYLISGSSDKTIKIWDLEAKNNKNEEGFFDCFMEISENQNPDQGPLTEILLTKDDKQIISVGFNIKFWEMTIGKTIDIEEKFFIKGDPINEILALAMTSDGKKIISGGTKRSNQIKIWDIKDFKRNLKPYNWNEFKNSKQNFFPLNQNQQIKKNQTQKFSAEQIPQIKGSQTQKNNFYENIQKYIRYEFEPDPIILNKHTKAINALAVSPSDHRLVSGSSDKRIILWDLITNSFLMEFNDQDQEINTLKYFPNGEFLVSGSGDSIIKVWDMRWNNLVGKIEGHHKAIKTLAISPDGKTIYSGSVDKSLRLWPLSTNHELCCLEGHSREITSLIIVDKYLYTSSLDKTIRCWELDSGKQKLILKGHNDSIKEIIYSKNHNILISAGEDAIKFWDLNTNEELLDETELDYEGFGAFALSENYNFLIAVTRKGKIIKWDWNFEDKYYKIDIDGFKEHVSDAVNILKVINENEFIVGDVERNLSKWDIKTKKMNENITKKKKHSDIINSIVLTSEFIISCGGEIIYWNRANCQYIKDFKLNVRFLIKNTENPNEIYYITKKNNINFFRIKKNGDKITEEIGVEIEDNSQNINRFAINFVPLQLSEEIPSKKNEIFVQKEQILLEEYSLTVKNPKSIFSQKKNHTKNLKPLENKPKLIKIPLETTLAFVSDPNNLVIQKKNIQNLIKLHSSRITAIELTPDGLFMISGGSDGSLIIWRLSDCEVVYKEKCHQDAIFSIIALPNSTLNPNENIVISASFDNNIFLWRFQSDSKGMQFEIIESSLKFERNSLRSCFRTCIAIYSPDEKVDDVYNKQKEKKLFLIIGSKGRVLEVWNMKLQNQITIKIEESDTLQKSTEKTKAGSQPLQRTLTKRKTLNPDINLEIETEREKSYVVVIIALKNSIILGYGNGKIYAISTIKHQNEKKMLEIETLEFEIEKNLSSIAELKFKGHTKEITSLIASNNQKLISSSLDNTIKFWNLKNGNLLQTIVMEQNIDFQIAKPSFLVKDRLLLINNLVYDISNELIVFKSNKNNNTQQKIYCSKFKTFYSFDKLTGILSNCSLINDSLLSYMKEFSKLHNFFQNTTMRLNRVLNGACILYPFYCNFLHLNAYFENTKFVLNNIEELEGVPLEAYIQKNSLEQTPISILLEYHNKALIKIYFQALFKSFKITNFIEKMKFFKQKFLFYSPGISTHPFFKKKIYEENQKDIPEKFNMYKYMIRLMIKDKNDLSIVSQILDNSLLELENINLSKQKELKSATYAITSNENKAEIAILYEIEQKRKHKLQENNNATIKAKIVALPYFTDSSKPKVHEFFEKLILVSDTNTIYSNEILRLIADYKWKKIYTNRFKKELLMFLLILACFLVNFAYVLPIKEQLIGMRAIIISTILNAILIIYFIGIFLFGIVNKIRELSWKYILSIWNIVDIILCFIVPASCVIDMVQLSLHELEMTVPKIIYSYAMFLLWFRVISFFRGFESTGFLLRLIFRVIFDIRFFLLFILIFILGFTYSAFLLQKDFNENYNHFEVWKMFYRLILGDFENYDVFYNEKIEVPFFFWILLMITTIFMTIILLNLLISIITDTFSKVLKTEESMKTYERLSLVIDFELRKHKNNLLRKKNNKNIKNNGDLVGKYLLYIYNETKDQEKKVSMESIMENIDEIKLEIKDVKGEIGKKNKDELNFDRMMGQIEEIKENVQKKMKDGMMDEFNEA